MRRPVVTGAQGMIGASAEVVADFTGTRPRALRRGAVERAQQRARCSAGEMARIVKVEGLTLWVEPQ